MELHSNELTVPCPACGQTLAVPTADLRHAYRCPRCQVIHRAEHLIDKKRPLRAVLVPAESESPSMFAEPVAGYTPAPPASNILAPPTPVHASTSVAVAAAEPGGTEPPCDNAPAVSSLTFPEATPAALDTIATAAEPATSGAPGVPRSSPSSPRVTFDAIGSAAMHRAKQAGTLTMRLMDLACDIDDRLYGKRLYVFLVAACLSSILGPLLDEPRDETWTNVFTAFFVLACAGMALAFVGSFRDDDGNWSADQARRHVLDVISLPIQAALDLTGLPRRALLARVGMIACGAGVVFLALRNALQILAGILGLNVRDTIQTLDAMGWLLVIPGGSLWISMWWAVRKDALLGRLRVARENVGEFKATIASAPRIVDCQDRGATLRLAESMSSPLMRQFFAVMAEWKPRGALDEKDCQYSLMRRLKRDMQDAAPEMEVPLGERRRGDIVLGDALLVEMKFNPNTGELDRADGQVGSYARLWATRGPVVFLLCETDPLRVMPRVRDMIARRETEAGTPVFAVFARR